MERAEGGEGQVLRGGYLPRVVGEHGGVACAKVKGAGVGVAGEDGGLGLALVEVQPLLGLSSECQCQWPPKGTHACTHIDVCL